MLSPLFDGPGFLFDESWEMTAFHREAAALTGMDEFWADVEAEARGFPLVAPPGPELDELDWSVREPEEHKDKLVHHDCMWAGLCEDKVHPGNTEPWGETVQSAAPGRSLLLVQRRCRRAVSPVARPETPLSPDEEEPPQFRHQVDVAGTARRLLHDTSASVQQDHSYTLHAPPHGRPASPPTPHASPAKHERFDNLGVQTPSDSEEEIDVVSLGEKSAQVGHTNVRPVTLPYVPSVLDQHNIQNTVASAMSPRGRKRSSLPAPEHGRKRGRAPVRRRENKRRSSPDTDSDLENTDVEKRSLHNDMERMRRIGLKNLFDQLKMQVPATRDKERAPKVVILREAAALCRRYQAEEREREMLKKTQTRLLARVKKLRMMNAKHMVTPY